MNLRSRSILVGGVSVLILVTVMMASHRIFAQGSQKGLDVNIVSPLPVPVAANDGLQSFQATAYCSSSNCVGKVNMFLAPGVLFVVPAGKRAVIEYFSAITNASPGEALTVGLGVDNQNILHLPSSAASSYAGQFAVGQQIRYYAEPGTTVGVFARVEPSISGHSVYFHITGHFVDVE